MPFLKAANTNNAVTKPPATKVPVGPRVWAMVYKNSSLPAFLPVRCTESLCRDETI